MRAHCTYRVVTFGDEREAVDEVDETRRRERRDHGERERDLEHQIRGVTRAERGDEIVRGRDDRIVVHARERFVREVDEVEERGDTQEAIHAREASPPESEKTISETNSITALSIWSTPGCSVGM
jgi:hypothetical protein